MKTTGEGLKLSASSKKALLQDLLECAITCEQCATGGMENENVMLSECRSLGRNCADICFHVSRMIVKGPMVTTDILAACEKACRMCMEECRKHEMDLCRTCAYACKRCAQTCRAFLDTLQTV